MSFTPGPWEVRRWGTNADAWPINRISVYSGMKAIVISPKYADVDDESNFALIAAAPDLYKTLEHGIVSFSALLRFAEKEIGHGIKGGVWLDEARKVLAKIENGSREI